MQIRITYQRPCFKNGIPKYVKIFANRRKEATEFIKGWEAQGNVELNTLIPCIAMWRSGLEAV